MHASPALLMRSGVGAAEHLGSVAVPVRPDLPGVGANLADHGGVDIDCRYRGPARAAPILHIGPAFHSSVTASQEAPDLMLRLSDPRGEPPIFEIDLVLLRPRARGAVRLRSPDPAEPPLIELPDRCDPFDVKGLLQGYRQGIAVASRPKIRHLCSASPSPSAHEADELANLIRADAYDYPHIAGTCSMGPRPADGAVVDTFGHVHGTERLSVVDASIVPNGPSAFTHVPTVMIAERLSEQIATQL